MKSLIADRVRRNNQKIKSQAEKNKMIIANSNKIIQVILHVKITCNLQFSMLL